MMNQRFFTVCTLLMFVCGGLAQAQDATPADVVFTNGKVYTVNEKQLWAEAVAVKGNKIVYVGDSEGAKAFVGDKTQMEDIDGKFMMPSIIDGHTHGNFYASAASGLVFPELTYAKEKMRAETNHKHRQEGT